MVHMHGPQYDEMAKLIALSEIKKKCQSSEDSDIPKIVNDVLGEKDQKQYQCLCVHLELLALLKHTIQSPLKKLRDKAEKIMDAMNLLDKVEIDVQGFLKRTLNSSSQMTDSSQEQQNPCIVCYTNPKSVLMRLCNKVKVCDSCWDQMRTLPIIYQYIQLVIKKYIW